MSIQGDSGGIFGNLIGSVLSNPTALSSVISALGGLMKQSDSDRDRDYEYSEQAENAEAHSELSSKLDEIIDRLDAESEKNTEVHSEKERPDPPLMPPREAETMGMLLRMLGSAGKKEKSAEEKHREALLCALKPYLAPERAAAIDKIIRLSELGNLFGRNLQGNVQQKHI